MPDSQAGKLLTEQARKKRASELFLPAAALFVYVLHWLNNHGWPIAGQLREQAIGIAALAAAFFWFGAMRAGMPGISAFLLGPVWILLIGDDGIGWLGLVAAVTLAGWKEEGWELPWKITLLALASWYLTGMVEADVDRLAGMPSGDKGVRQLALLTGLALWAVMIAASLPLWIAAPLIAASYYWRVSSLLCWAALMAVSFLWLVFRRKPVTRSPGSRPESSGARFATPEETQDYRYD